MSFLQTAPPSKSVYKDITLSCILYSFNKYIWTYNDCSWYVLISEGINMLIMEFRMEQGKDGTRLIMTSIFKIIITV